MKRKKITGQIYFTDVLKSTETLETTIITMLNERIDNYGILALHDEEILSILTGIDITKIRGYMLEYGVMELIRYIDSLKITKMQKKKLMLMYEFVKRISTSEFKEKTILNSCVSAGEFFVNDLRFYKNEVFKMAILDAQNRLISLETISEGIVNQAPIYIRSVIKVALDKNAISVIISHNHPSGSTEPSKDDIAVTNRIVTALNTVSINTLDHIIVAENKYISFAERGLI